MTMLGYVRKKMSVLNLDAYVIFNDINISYLTGVNASDSWLLILPKQAYYLTDARYTEEVNAVLPRGIKVHQYAKSFYHSVFELCVKAHVKTLGFDDNHISLARFKVLKKTCPKGMALTAKPGLIEWMRETKSKEELDCIRQALVIHRAALKYIKPHLKPGVTEQDVLLKLENYIRKRGVTFSFSPIIASGPNSAFPHAHVTDRKLRKNEPILVDMGVNYKGYMSDLTRMFFLGRMHKHFEGIVEHVTHAQQCAIQHIKAGVNAADVDAQARNYLKQNDLAQYFGHSLGHGVGREIHENPRLSFNNHQPLRENMIVTVEPGVYLPQQFGVRIEDMVRVTQDGCEVL